ncbi:molecular chaperone DnaJ [Sphingomonas ginkgonis]|uniref:Chaperone protein DnaJ n=1 Tax=Sphingomonas ginkgonis TaxID=2315330 RepID=A0A3R9YNP0_9SPHN|nr:molecular chaperone DnaJ [Sphingomonas ginkgonis]RST31898.1 molecular chaperone DnaJ [Sphingomonas ginkgonis]
MVQIDFYELLGIERTADDRTIKSAYRRLAMECHPDRTGGCKDNEARFKEITAAYDCLKDPQKRAAYDRFGHAAFQNGGGGGNPFGQQGFDGFSDIFSSIFGEFMDPRGQRQNAGRGADLRYDLELTLEEAFAGKEARLEVETLARCGGCEGRGSRGDARAATCSTCGGMGKVRAQQGFFMVERLCPGCQGSGQVIADPCLACEGEGRTLSQRTLNVQIPAGVDEGTRIRVAGEGEAGIRGAGAGDLYIFVHMKRHPIFEREGTTLVADCPVSFTAAALGGAMTICGVDGKPVEMKIPPGIQSGEQLRQRGVGMTILNGRGRGDLVARIHVETPTRLSAKQKELLAAFRDTETGEECPASRSFFTRIKDMLGA